MTPIQPRALKVEGGHVTNVQEEGTSQRPPHVTEASLSAPDGTYLRLDYVLDVVDGLRAQHGAGDVERSLGSLSTFFASRAL